MKPLPKGFALIEVALAITISILVIVGILMAYGLYLNEARYQKAKLIISAVRTNIDVEKTATNFFPTLAAITANTRVSDSTKKFYANYGGGVQGDCNGNGAIDVTESNLPCDPFLNKSTVSTGLVALGPPSVGGWVYDATTGTFKINLHDTNYGIAGTVKKFPDNPSTW